MIRVLYAEDDAQVAGVVSLSFSKNPTCSLDVVSTGRDCLAAMLKPDYDVLLLDLVMPDINGLQVLNELSARRDSRPVIMVSGHGQHDLAVRALRAGAVDCIDKNSAEFRRIPDIVERAFNRHPRHAQTHRAGEHNPHSVLVLEPDASERDNLALFLASSVPGLNIQAEPPAFLDDAPHR
jgi:DNA-binding NtrC family response regulator